MRKFHYIILLVVVAFVTGCSSIDCSLEGKVLCHLTVQDGDGQPMKFNYPLSVILNRTAVDTDTTFINQMQDVNSIDMPLSFQGDMDKVTLTMTVDSTRTISDDIFIGKTNEPVFESVDCPARYRHEITTVSSTHNFIDTIIINNPKVSNDASVQNIIIRVRH